MKKLASTEVTKDFNKKEYIVKVVNISSDPQEINIRFDRLPRRQKLAADVSCTSLHSDDAVGENSLETPDFIVPVTVQVEDGIVENHFRTDIGPKTFAVYKFRYTE